MKHKVLLADDSSTIQKVIKITLAGSPFEIVEASSEDELFQKLEDSKPELILLDFNLSEKLTGLELIAKVKEESPQSRILLLLGTFDSVDEGALKKAGASDKIVKPFDSTKFISLCHRLIEENDQSIPLNTHHDSSSDEFLELPPKINEDEQWSVSGPSLESDKTALYQIPPEVLPTNEENPLAQEVHDWGMQVPPPLSNDSSPENLLPEDLPPIIQNTSIKSSPQIKYPDHEDLDYPDTSSPVEDLVFQGLHEQEDNTQKIEAQIQDEVADDLWNVDEYLNDSESSSSSLLDDQPIKDEIKNKVEKINLLSEVESLKLETKMTDSSVDLDQIKEEIQKDMEKTMEESIKKYVEFFVKKYMDEMYSKSVEKISWDIIPDLAENLIRQELTKIADKIQNQ